MEKASQGMYSSVSLRQERPARAQLKYLDAPLRDNEAKSVPVILHWLNVCSVAYLTTALLVPTWQVKIVHIWLYIGLATIMAFFGDWEPAARATPCITFTLGTLVTGHACLNQQILQNISGLALMAIPSVPRATLVLLPTGPWHRFYQSPPRAPTAMERADADCQWPKNFKPNVAYINGCFAAYVAALLVEPHSEMKIALLWCYIAFVTFCTLVGSRPPLAYAEIWVSCGLGIWTLATTSYSSPANVYMQKFSGGVLLFMPGLAYTWRKD